MKFLNRVKCEHKFKTISNFGGDYINAVTPRWSNKIYRSRQMCIRCGKQRLSEYLDDNCKVINDDYQHKFL